jgi:CDP-6-deoxy-D-xylo-4-hexulose-3-dehydrase
LKKIRYHLAEDTIDDRDIDSLVRWLKTYPRLTKGKLNLKFEERWSKWLGRKYSVSCNSGSSANLLMYEALRVSGRLKNMKVIVPSVGWVTSIAPAMQLGFTPIMCEADPDTFGLDLVQLETLLKKHRPSTVLLVQVLGVPHKMKEILALKKKYGFFLLEDACAAIGAEYGGKKVGAFGDMSSFSFYFGHQMSTIEGGMVSTDDAGFRDLLLMLRSHGWSKDLDRKAHGKLVREHKVDDFHSPFVFYIPGYNLRSTDLNAQLGLNQVAKLTRMTRARQKNHELYRKLLGGRFRVQRPPAGAKSASISFGLLADSTEQRRRIVDALVRNGIETRIFSAGNLGLHPFWYERYGRFSAPTADRIHYTGFFLPNNPSLGPAQIRFIAGVVLGAC